MSRRTGSIATRSLRPLAGHFRADQFTARNYQVALQPSPFRGDEGAIAARGQRARDVDGGALGAPRIKFWDDLKDGRTADLLRSVVRRLIDMARQFA